MTVIAAHWGGGLPFYALMPEVREALENVYFDTAASHLLYDATVYRRVIELVGVGEGAVGQRLSADDRRRRRWSARARPG